MQKATKKLLLIALSLVVIQGFYTAVDAYVLQGPHILELMVQNLGKAKRLLVSQRVIIHDNAVDGDRQEVKETVRYVFPETFRSDVLSETTQRIYVFAKGVSLTVIDEKASIGGETRFDHYKDILLFHSRIMLAEMLSASGIDVSISSLGRFQGKIAFVVGIEYPDETHSQVWIEKETFRPLRWILKSDSTENSSDTLEFRYQNWQEFDTTVYPMKIEFFQDGTLVRQIQVDTVAVDPIFSENLFNISYLQSRYLPKVPDKPEAEALNEVQKAIDEFKKRYE